MSKIDLKIKRDRGRPEKIEGPEYPSLYLSDIDLPLSKNNIGQDFKAAVTLKFTGYREDNSTRKNHKSFDFAIKNIEFSGKNIAESNAGKKLNKVFGD